MLDIILPSTLLFFLIYGLHRLPVYLRSSSLLLPTHRLSSRSTAEPAKWKIEWSLPTLTLYTKSFNSIPRTFIGQRWKRAWRMFYGLGAVVGMLGCLGALGGGIWASDGVWTVVREEMKLHAETGARSHGAMMKRGVMQVIDRLPDPGASFASAAGVLQPVIPGLTVPLSQLPTLALSLVVCQLAHELGHSLSAALDDIAPSRFSFNLHLFVPSMIVSFPSAIKSLTPSARLRLATAGAWHNLVMFAFFYLAAFAGLSRIWWSDVTTQGRVIDYVDETSQLHGRLSTGSIITHLDDWPIGGPQDKWTEYLESNLIGDVDRGWCITKMEWERRQEPPCSVPDHIIFQPTFQTRSHRLDQRCLSPLPLIGAPSDWCPCKDENMICVRPSPEAQILRIRADGRTILWHGERSDILRHISVGMWKARGWKSLVHWLTAFAEAITSISISLFFFNLLPLPHADGSHVLSAILDSSPFGSARRRDSPELDQSDPISLKAVVENGGADSTTTSSGLNGSASRRYHPSLPNGNYADPDGMDRSESSDEDSVDMRYDARSSGDHDEEEGPRQYSRTSDKGRSWTRRKRLIMRVVEGLTLVLLGIWLAGWAMIALLRSS